MQTRKKTIFYSVLFGLAMEFQVNVLLQHNISGMIFVIVLYSLIGAMTYKTFPYVVNLFAKPHVGFWWAFIIHGLLGLFIIEWNFMGNTFTKVTPGSGPIIAMIAEIGMFMWWGTIAAMPYLLQQPEGIILKKKIFWYYGIYAVVSTGLAIPFGMAPMILLEPPVYLGFLYFYRKFSFALQHRSLVPSPGIEPGITA